MTNASLPLSISTLYPERSALLITPVSPLRYRPALMRSAVTMIRCPSLSIVGILLLRRLGLTRAALCEPVSLLLEPLQRALSALLTAAAHDLHPQAQRITPCSRPRSMHATHAARRASHVSALAASGIS